MDIEAVKLKKYFNKSDSTYLNIVVASLRARQIIDDRFEKLVIEEDIEDSDQLDKAHQVWKCDEQITIPNYVNMPKTIDFIRKFDARSCLLFCFSKPIYIFCEGLGAYPAFGNPWI